MAYLKIEFSVEFKFHQISNFYRSAEERISTSTPMTMLGRYAFVRFEIFELLLKFELLYNGRGRINDSLNVVAVASFKDVPPKSPQNLNSICL